MPSYKPYFYNPILQNLIEKFKLITFDVNGLIIDDESIQLNAVNLAFASIGYSIKIDDSYWIANCVGHRADVYFKEILYESLNYKDVIKANAEEVISLLIKKKNEYYTKILKSKIFNIVRPGVLDFIKYLVERKKVSNQILAIATSAVDNEADSIIGSYGLNIAKYFDIIVTGSDIKKSKPDPEIYEKVLRLAKVKPINGVVFEDSETGVEAAFKTGLTVIAVPNRYTRDQKFNKATYILSDFKKKARIITNNIQSN